MAPCRRRQWFTARFSGGTVPAAVGTGDGVCRPRPLRREAQAVSAGGRGPQWAAPVLLPRRVVSEAAGAAVLAETPQGAADRVRQWEVPVRRWAAGQAAPVLLPPRAALEAAGAAVSAEAPAAALEAAAVAASAEVAAVVASVEAAPEAVDLAGDGDSSLVQLKLYF